MNKEEKEQCKCRACSEYGADPFLSDEEIKHAKREKEKNNPPLARG